MQTDYRSIKQTFIFYEERYVSVILRQVLPYHQTIIYSLKHMSAGEVSPAEISAGTSWSSDVKFVGLRPVRGAHKENSVNDLAYFARPFTF